MWLNTCQLAESSALDPRARPGSRNPAIAALLEWIKFRVRTPLDAQSFPSFEDRSAQSQCLHGTAFAMPHQLKNSNCGTRSRRSKVKWKANSNSAPAGSWLLDGAG